MHEQCEPACQIDEDVQRSLRMAEQGWADLVDAAKRIQQAADQLKREEPPMSIVGFDIEKALWRHKTELMEKHLANIRGYMQQNNVPTGERLNTAIARACRAEDAKR